MVGSVMDKPQVEGVILAELADCAASAKDLVLGLNNETYGDVHDLRVDLRMLKTRGEVIAQLARKALAKTGV
jgi:hypothetical protein